MKYEYRDFITGKTRWTAGTFLGWTEPAGPLQVRYAIFQRKSGTLFVPKYLLSKGTLAALCAQREGTAHQST